MTDAAWLSARELLAAYAARELSPVEAVDACAARIVELNQPLNVFTALCLDRALDEARAAEAAWLRDEPSGPLCGVPFASKDLFDTAGLETACGSPILAGRVPDTDATAVARAGERGAILLGKTATHEFAWGLTMVNEHLGDTGNPWDPERTPGGSSGGSAVALATGMTPLALGSDTGGSIRVPAAFCGVLGLKPTRGRVSLAGCWPLARTLDHAGPMARTPEDTALLLEAIAGPDPGDPATVGAPPLDLAASESGIADLAIGVAATHPVTLAAEVAAALASAAEALERAGARVREIALPDTEKTFGTIFRAEALDTHVRAGLWPDRRDEYGANVRPWLERAERVGLHDYLAAQAERERLRAEALRLFDDIDLLLTPVCATPAPRLEDSDAVVRDVALPFTCPQDLFGLPACALRAGFDDAGVPVGVQLSGPPWQEARVLRAARALFDATPELQTRRP